ncbi:hypothetical protein ABFS82_14G225800 [Erythranthe guttata]|uniref:Bifunctional inhibitor/plant lipid transfer protein/seed storage helical domain-containing protein n=1 Tax=Erythranthe guttata TaxID=4155 RepID=A0A022R6Y4_ERYGU|nr:PREDICTED: non-specific lipid-transfer protein-like protein At2g13820 [Erythranthe guttata]EYU35991.1 hypothetical protein MIMGU_mgv1a013823mg [Erythranthe guttata]|eukprot:XP_012838301.1 PREDICTED: non-specific lipid-transfer protein-like protein At2g13820 [Erythranthe guttata]
MATKPQTTTTAAASVTAFLLITASIFLAALPKIEAQTPAPAPTPPAAAAPSPESPPASAPTPPDAAAAPAPGPDCMTALFDLADCLSFVDEGSNLTKPDPLCCPEVEELVKTQPICLCELLSNSSQFEISIDKNKALMLPSLCSIETPSVSFCAVFGIPVAVPVPAPSPNPTAATPPSVNEDNAGTNNLLPSNQHLLIGLTLVFFTYFL